MSDDHPLTQRQIRCLEELSEEYGLVSTDGVPIVHGPKGELLRVKRSGRLEAIVESVQSYLRVSG